MDRNIICASHYRLLKELEESIRDTLAWDIGIDDGEIDAETLSLAADATDEAWELDGWYDLMSGACSIGDPSYYGEESDLGAIIYLTMARNGKVWAYKYTDPDEIAELEAMFD